ncbi:MAG: hypothetical protein WD042_17695 [Phycisphaeraceae bacterium]
MIELDLMPILFQEARGADLSVGRDCEREVRDFITPQDQLYQASTPEVRQQISENFRRFVKAMIDEAKRRGLPELRESTFHAARAGICPLFPFC